MTTFGAPYGGAQGAGDAPPRPPAVRENVVASKNFFASNSRQQVTQAAAAIFQRHWGDISQFMMGQRQMGLILPASYKQVNYADLSIEYQRLGNQETLLLTAYPDTDTPNPQSVIVDINYDGYVAWIHHQSAQYVYLDGGRSIAGPFDIFFNGYLIEQDFQPTRGSGGYVILFGKTALLAQSYQDDGGRKNNDLINSNPRDKIKSVTPRPGWGTFPDGTSPTGEDQSKLTKELGYWIFDWGNKYNPCNYFDNGTQFQDWVTMTQGDGLPIKLSQGLWFEFAENSPLNYKGPNNTFAVMLSPHSRGGEVLLNGAIIAEFYDRNKFRTVSSSWKYDGTVNIDDSPLLWGSGYNIGGFFNGTVMTWDLTPSADKQVDGSNLLGPHDGLQNTGQHGDPGNPGLSDSDYAKIVQWHNTTKQLDQMYQRSIQQYINAWQQNWTTAANLKLLNQAYNIFGWFSTVTDANGKFTQGGGETGDPTGMDRVNALGRGYKPVYGPVQQYWWDWNFPYTISNPLPKIAARYLAFNAVNDGDASFADTLGNPINPKADDYGGSFPGPQPASRDQMFQFAKNYLAGSNNAIQNRQNDYDKIFTDHTPPPYPERPSVGKDYTRFSYRKVSISGGEWSYGNFSGGSK